MLEIKIDNCHKCDIETIIDPNNSQHFWINGRDLEIETKRNWQAIFDKCKDSSTQKYRKELTPNITFQANKIFVRKGLFEKIIKSCKATKVYAFMKTIVMHKSLFQCQKKFLKKKKVLHSMMLEISN